MQPQLALVICAATLVASGCSAVFEGQTRERLGRQGELLGPARGEQRAHGPAARFSGELDDYLTYTLEHSPQVRGAYDDWRAATFRITPARQLPEPTLTYAYFIQSVETRVGPQRHRFSISQRFPWPTKLTAAADAASLAASAAEQRYQSTGLMVARRVATAYWMLWRIDQERKVLRDQIVLVRAMAETARARVEVGMGGIAAVSQIELSRSRLIDARTALDEKRQQASAELVAATGAPPGTKTPIEDVDPPLLAVAESQSALHEAVASHPRIEALDFMADAKEAMAESVGASAYPSFMAGLTVIETGRTPMPNVADSGKDPVIVSLSANIPIWQGSYGDKVDAARAEGAAFRAKRAAAQDNALAALAQVLSKLRDAIRRIKLYRTTLIPQAETVFGAVLAEYQAGNAGVAPTLLAQRELLQLQMALFRSQAEHAVVWTRLEELVGRAVRAREVKVARPDTK